MMALARRPELENDYIVIQCVYSDKSTPLSARGIRRMSRLHLKKIALSDAIFVVNVDGYIGGSTKKEIDYARSLNKEIFYLEPTDTDR